MTNKLEEVRNAYREKVAAANKRNQENAVLRNLYKLTEAQQESIKTIAMLSDAVGGDKKLHELMQAYSIIKSSNKK